MIDKKFDTLILISSNSVHSRRYLDGVLPYFNKVVFITNNKNDLPMEDNLVIHVFKFKLLRVKVRAQIAAVINAYPGSIVHVHQANSYAYHTFKALKQVNATHKTILTTWGSDILVLPKKNILYKRMVQFSLKRADIITSDSLYMSDEIRLMCKRVKNLHTINFGMKDFPKSLNLSYKEDIILSNRLHKKLYNIDKIIIGFSNFLIKNPQYQHFQLIIAASGIEIESLEDLVEVLKLEDKIIFTGMLTADELKRLYQISKVFISIPSSDATSMSVLEAMGYGCYPILSNLPANLEWVINNANGSIVMNNDKLDVDLKNVIDEIQDVAKYQKLAQYNYELIKENAVFENNLQKFLKLYSEDK